MHMMMQMMGRMMASGPAGRGEWRRFERIEGQLAYFRTERKITDAQIARWESFAAAVRAAGTVWRQVVARQEGVPSRSAIDQLDQQSELLLPSWTPRGRWRPPAGPCMRPWPSRRSAWRTIWWPSISLPCSALSPGGTADDRRSSYLFMHGSHGGHGHGANEGKSGRGTGRPRTD